MLRFRLFATEIFHDDSISVLDQQTAGKIEFRGKGAEIGDTIPAALFGAVAEVLAYLVRIKQLML